MTITHDTAADSLQRFIDGAFMAGEGPRLSIPARPDHDDDLILARYIAQQRAAGTRGAALWYGLQALIVAWRTGAVDSGDRLSADAVEGLINDPACAPPARVSRSALAIAKERALRRLGADLRDRLDRHAHIADDTPIELSPREVREIMRALPPRVTE